MKTVNRIAAAANGLLMAFTLLVASLMMIYGMYVLYDIFYTGQSAYSSHDLLQYRPKMTEESDNDMAKGFRELNEINPDVVGWIEIFGTHINYPVVQGRDDLEYLNKDIYGNSSLTGSIYLSAGNAADFNDWYNIIYGHHIDNGAMFGDIDKYLDKEYFDSHKTGVLQTASGTYDVQVFACISTDSYNGTVYNTESDAQELYPELKEYILEHSMNLSGIPEEIDNMGIVGFSTCNDATTNGRIVLFARLEPHDSANDILADYSGRTDESTPAGDITKLLKAVGHYSDSEHWAFLNLISLLFTFLTLLPVLSIRRKYRQIRYSKKKAREIKHVQEDNEDAEKICTDLNGFVKKMRVGLILEILAVVAAMLVFVLTEDISKKVVIRDKYTGLMILIEATALMIDFICFRYRGKRPENTQNENTSDTAVE